MLNQTLCMNRIIKTVMFAVALTANPYIVMADKPDKDMLEQGKTLFLTGATPACAICHTLKDADSVGAVGPDLDELNPDLNQIKKALKEGVGVMPSFADSLSEQELEAVAQYVFHATHSND